MAKYCCSFPSLYGLQRQKDSNQVKPVKLRVKPSLLFKVGCLHVILGGGFGLLSVKDGEESGGLCCWFFLVSFGSIQLS